MLRGDGGKGAAEHEVGGWTADESGFGLLFRHVESLCGIDIIALFAQPQGALGLRVRGRGSGEGCEPASALRTFDPQATQQLRCIFGRYAVSSPPNPLRLHRSRVASTPSAVTYEAFFAVRRPRAAMSSRKRSKASDAPSVRPCCRPNAPARALRFHLAPASGFPERGRCGREPSVSCSRAARALVREFILRRPVDHPRLDRLHCRRHSSRSHLLLSRMHAAALARARALHHCGLRVARAARVRRARRACRARHPRLAHRHHHCHCGRLCFLSTALVYVFRYSRATSACRATLPRYIRATLNCGK